MDIWYTPERIELQREIAQRRIARYERRKVTSVREERRNRVIGAIKMAVGMVIATIGFWAACLWAFL